MSKNATHDLASGGTLPSDAPSLDQPQVKLRVGAVLGHHVIESLLGVGGMGEVYAARDVESGEQVALKLLAEARATTLYRFKREFRALADVEHDNLARLFELAVSPAGLAYFTMELVEGQTFVDWVRAGLGETDTPSWTRLEDALVQLTTGVAHLHERRCIHRDLKPSNVLVTDTGRVVILDFGLVAEHTEVEARVTRDGQLLGTPTYMAPEQAIGKPVESSADLYAIGVMLYECLTGRPPFEGTALRLMMLKQELDAPDPSMVQAKVPARLAELCIELLAREPSLRPTAVQLLARLGGEAAPGSAESQRSAQVDTEIFVGRERELELLRAEAARLASGAGVSVVRVIGPSGLGKSALTRRLRSELSGSYTILAGRCRARESMPYKGVDAVVDRVFAQLHRHTAAQLDELAPPDVDALVRVFPVLGELWPVTSTQLLGPKELRSLAWNALRTLLVQLATQRPLLIHIDDFHWSDVDSVRLLESIVSGPEPPHLLLLLSYRDDRAHAAVEALSESEHLSGALTRELELGPLDASDSQALARALLHARAAPSESGVRDRLDERAEVVALRGAGNPLFIGQMVLGEDSPSDADLDELLLDRLAALEPARRELLELVAVAGGPLALTTIDALGPQGWRAHVEGLCSEDLLVRDRALVEVTHDRIRELVLGELGASRSAKIHGALGRLALEQHGGEPPAELLFAIVDHLNASVVELDELELDARLELASLSARTGAQALAATAWELALRYFEGARELCQVCLAAAREGRGEHELCRAIVFGYAEAAARCGRGEQAFDELLGWELTAKHYAEIATRRVLVLVHLDRHAEAVDRALELLAWLGVDEPKHPSAWRVALAVRRGWRGLGRRSLDELSELGPVHDAEARARMDVLAICLGSSILVDRKLYMTLAGRYSQMIAAHGHHARMTYAMSALAYSMVVQGRPREAGALCERAFALAESEPAPAESLIAAKTIALLFVWPSCRPFAGLLSELGPTHDRACELGQSRLAGYLASTGGGLLIAGGTPIPELLAYLDGTEARNPGFGGREYEKTVRVHRSYAAALTEGAAVIDADALDSMYELTHASCVVAEVNAALLLGRLDHARARAAQLETDYADLMQGSWDVPRFAMLCAVLANLRPPGRSIRRHRAIAARFAHFCPENYGPMLAMVEAEHAISRGRHDAAMAAYERARIGAKSQGLDCVVGLASERLACLCRGRSFTMAADAAEQAAAEAYARWGASAVVERLERDGILAPA